MELNGEYYQPFQLAKTCQNADTSAKIIKLNIYIFLKFIGDNFNHCIDDGEFSYELKHVDVILVHKKESRRITVQYAYYQTSKLYGKLLYNQFYSQFDNILSPRSM